jgi:Holliday junction DNA helicase RuvB
MGKAPSLAISTELLEGLAPKEAARRARAGLRGGDLGHRVAAFYLADLIEREGFLELGYTSVSDFARRYLRQPASTITKLARVGCALRSLPVIDAFFEADRITWTQVKDLVRVATPETERAWAEWAENRSTRQVTAQVERSEKGDLPTAPSRRRIHQPTVHVGADLSGTRFRIWELSRAKLEAQYGGPLSDRDMMMHVAQLIQLQRPDGTVPGWSRVNDRHYLLHVYPRGLGSDELVAVGAEGEEIEIDPAELEWSPSLPSLPSPPSPGAVVAAVDPAAVDPENYGPLVPEAERDAPTDPDLREEILRRDAYSCRCCGSKDNVTVHHRVWLSYGGKTTPSNLFAACEGCHSLIHDRRLIALGDPEGELYFLDREGGSRERAPTQPVELQVKPAATATAARTESQLVDLDRLPAEVDADWWIRHEHLLSWHERSSELLLKSGFAREVAAQAGRGQVARPASRLSELVGQTEVRERLEVAIGAARLRGEQPRHLLFAGGPGLGKTSFAQAVAAELEAPLITLAAPHVRTPDALVRALVSIPERGVLFLDEVHALPARTAEVLYEALDAGALSMPVRQGSRVRVLAIRLRPFTLIGATTELDQLTRPLLSRLDVLRVEPYSAEELATILDRAARGHGLELTPDGAERLALASRDTPRRALTLLRAVRDEASMAQVTVADEVVVERALTRQGVDADGLDRLDRRYLGLLKAARQPMGLRTLAARLDVPEETLRTVYEPHLVRRGLVRVTPAGRVRGSGQSAAPAAVHSAASAEGSAA